jgi:hypothetical protein
MNLGFDLVRVWTRLPAQVGVRDNRTRLHPTRESQNRKYEQELYPDILDVPPQKTIAGYLSFDWDYGGGTNGPFTIHIDDDSHTFDAGEQARFELTVHDYVSGQSVVIEVPGVWPA